MKSKTYEISVNLNILNHLGIKLYSNIPAVISEVVANAWDADAQNVNINIMNDQITITDDGHGMSYEELNSRYLNVGYERRKKSAVTPKFKRKVMGRKGIGKLSLFSIADSIKLQSRAGNEVNGFAMEASEIKKIIKSGKGSYQPVELSKKEFDLNKTGTKIVLKNLKKKIVNTETAIIKRVARRFSVISKESKFSVKINGKAISVSDRNYFHKIENIWLFGKKSLKYKKMSKKFDSVNIRPDVLKDGNKVSGWIGTVEKAGDLKDGEDNINKIVIMVRGKLAQEDILEEFGEGGIYTKYLIGEIHADFLDTDDEDDIATSSRQKIIEDDPRYISLRSWVKDELKHIQGEWTSLRNESGKEKAVQNPAIKKWFDKLSGDSKKTAEQLFGKINQLTLEDEDQRKTLFKHGVLAFESLRYKDNLSALDKISIDNIKEFTEIFANLDDIEATLYHQIIKERISVIEVLMQKTDDNALEKAIQKHLYEHLWLLDPSWDRATETPSMEQQVSKEFSKLNAKLTQEEKNARFDIKYKKSTGKHIIIELKRPGVTIQTTDLIKQVDKYRNALTKLLHESGIKDEPIEVICIVGKALGDWKTAKSREESIKMQDQKNIRTLQYKELVENAYKTYEKFLDKNKEAGRLYQLIQEIEDN